MRLRSLRLGLHYIGRILFAPGDGGAMLWGDESGLLWEDSTALNWDEAA